MSRRFLASVTALAAMAAVSIAQTPAAKAPAAKAKPAAIPRMPDGHPDFQGVWTNATITPMTRPPQFKDKATITDAEAKAYEKNDLDVLKSQDGASDGPLLRAAGSSGTGGYNFLFVDRGTELARVDGQARTSLIIDPPDGSMPRMIPRTRPRAAGGGQGEAYAGMSYDSIKVRPLSERCLIGFGSTSGPPMLPVLYNNNYEIVQTPDTILILVEMVHDARIIRINAQHAPPALDKWLGDSVGHWEGDTLVVETTNVGGEESFPRRVGESPSDRALQARRCRHDSLSRDDRGSGQRTRSHGRWNIRSWRRRARFMSTRATKGITPCRIFWVALGGRKR